MIYQQGLDATSRKGEGTIWQETEGISERGNDVVGNWIWKLDFERVTIVDENLLFGRR